MLPFLRSSRRRLGVAFSVFSPAVKPPPLGACCFGFQTKTTPFAARSFGPKRAYARRSGRMRLTRGAAAPPSCGNSPSGLVALSVPLFCAVSALGGRKRVQVSLEHERFVWGRGGIHKGVSPYVCFLSCFLHKQKTSRLSVRERTPRAARGTPLKEGKVLHRCTKRTTVRAGTDTPCRSRHTPSGTPARCSAYTPASFGYSCQGRSRLGWRRCRA